MHTQTLLLTLNFGFHKSQIRSSAAKILSFSPRRLALDLQQVLGVVIQAGEEACKAYIPSLSAHNQQVSILRELQRVHAESRPHAQFGSGG